MINKLKKNAHCISVFSVIFYITTLFLTFDIYCKNQVTPETPLLNIAGLPFLRMDFLLIIFTLAFLIGAVIVHIFKKAVGFLLPFALGFSGLLSLFIALFDVNTLQLFDPTMRISHVIMTVSRVLAITAGVSGGFIGAVCTMIYRKKASVKSIALYSMLAVILSVFANAENMQNWLFLISAILLLGSSILNDFSKNTVYDKAKRDSSPASIKICSFLSTVCFTSLIGISYSTLCENAGILELGYTASLGIIVTIFAFSLSLHFNSVLQPIALLLGSILSYIFIHYASDVVTYSGNRVIYITPYYISIFLIAIIIFTNLILLKKYYYQNKE